MTNNNSGSTTIDQRVLSVSYGCFSIHLQGFEDPFAIMKRVTEYFRLVSLEDITFGSKPLFEDASVLENLDTTAFGDDVSFANEGTTLTLTPADEYVLPIQEPTPDIFVLEDPQMDVPMELTVAQETPKPNTASSLDAAIANVLRKSSITEKPTVEPAQETMETTDVDPSLQSLIDAVAEANVETTETTPVVAEAKQVSLQVQAEETSEEKPRHTLRIIRNDYTYDPTDADAEVKIEEKPAAVSKPVAVNPFRKFPVKQEALGPKAAPANKAVELPAEKPITSYRKLSV